MRLKNTKIGYRLVLGFGMVIIITILIGLIANININRMWLITENMYKHPFTVSKAVRDIRTNIIAMHRSMKDVPLASDDNQINQAKTKVDEYERQVYKSFDIVFDRFLGEMSDVQSAYNAFVNWKPIREEVIRLQLEGNKEEAATITKGKGANHVDNLNRKIQTMIDFANQKGDNFYKEAELVKNTTIKSSLILLLVIVSIGLLVAVLITYSIIKPLSSMLDVSKRLTKGDLSVRNIDITTEETGLLALSINELADSIQSRIITQKNVTDISETMIGKSTMKEFGRDLLKQLMQITKANMSAFYILNKANSEFEHFDSIGANKRSLRSFSTQNAEGEFGNVLSTKKINYIYNISEHNTFTLKTTLGDITPKEIITIPVLIKNTVVAIISLVSIHKFSSECYEVLEQSWTNICTSYSNLMAGERTRILAESLTRTNKQLETKSKELEEKTIKLQEQSNELQEQNIKLEIQRNKVEEANRLKSEFLSNMSHELRTPLNSINSLSQVLILQAKEKLNNDENNYLEVIERNGKRLLSLINNILDLSKIEAGKMDVLYRAVSIKTLISAIMENLQTMATNKGVIINSQMPDNMPLVETDESKLYQVITNIVSNAIKFTEKGSVSVTAKFKNNYIYIYVKDTGIGVSEKMLPHIFDEFRQVDGSASRLHEGTGLGLAIANKMIKILGGKITVESKLGKGSIFTIIVPLIWHHEKITNYYLNNENDKSATKTPKAENKKEIPDKITHSILIVEDNPDNMITIKAILQKKYNIIEAYDGKRGLEIVQSQMPDIVLLDMLLPKISGEKIVRILKENVDTQKIPVIAITASVMQGDKERFLNAGCDDFVAKPIDAELLKRKIITLLKDTSNN